MIDVAQILRDTFVERVEHYPSLSSTNDRAAECAKDQNDRSPLLILADRQTKGRGRGAKQWWTGQNALAMSLLIDPAAVGAEHHRSPLVALATAVALVDAVAPRLPGHNVGIHWPNDVFVRDSESRCRKLAGILVEVLPDRRHIIGIGVNTNNTLNDAPPELRDTVCTMRDLNACEQNTFEILIALLQCLRQEYADLCRDPKRLMARMNSLCLQRGSVLTLDVAGKTITGRCHGVANDGGLLIETPTGVQSFASGVVRRLP